MPKQEIEEALSYTWPYVDQVVKSRAKNLTMGQDVLPAKDRPRIRDNSWWLDSERKKMNFESPPPWNQKLADQLSPFARKHRHRQLIVET